MRFLLPLMLVGCGFSRVPAVGDDDVASDANSGLGPLTLQIAAGDLQQATVGTQLPIPIAIVATKADQTPVENLTVELAATNGAVVSPATMRTDVHGLAQATVTLGGAVGDNAITASADDASAATLHELGMVGAAAKLAKVSADPAPAVVGTTLDPLQIRVSDAFDNPVPQAEVTFAVSAGNGTLATVDAMTDADGLASTALTLGAKAGVNTVTATLAAVGSVAFDAAGLVGPVSALVATAGANQNVAVGTVVPVTITAEDQLGNGVPGIAIGFAVTGGGGHISVATDVTDASGNATTQFTLGSTPGANHLAASATGLATLAIDEVALTGTLSHLVLVSPQTAQTAQVATAVAPLVVAAQDAAGNPVVGATVTFATTGGTLSATSAMTDAAGHAQTTLTLATMAGANMVTASAAPLATKVTMTATGNPGPAKVLAPFSPTSSSGLVGTLAAPTIAPAVRVTDQYGNPIASYQVTATTTGDGVLATPSLITNQSGIAIASYRYGTTTATVKLAGTAGLTGSPASFTAVGRGFTSTNTQASWSVIGDFNRDQKPDLATSNLVLRNTTVPSALTVSFVQEFNSTGNLGNASVVGDFNGDGLQDLAYLIYNGNLEVALNTTTVLGGPTTFATPIDLPFGQTDVYALEAVDLDRDGIDDLVMIKSQSVTVRFGTTPPGSSAVAFSDESSVLLCDNCNGVALGDLDGDGRIDLAITQNTKVTLLRNLTAMHATTFGAARTDLTYSAGTQLQIADFSSDGKPDVIVATNTPPYKVSIFVNPLQNGDGNRIDVSTVYPSQLFVGDFNGDGMQDLLIVNPTIHLYTGAAYTHWTMASTNGSVGAVDLNGDGVLDLIDQSGRIYLGPH